MRSLPYYYQLHEKNTFPKLSNPAQKTQIQTYPITIPNLAKTKLPKNPSKFRPNELPLRRLKLQSPRKIRPA